MSLDTIPEDVLERIADFLDRNDLLRLLRVNRSLQIPLLRHLYRNLDCSMMSSDVKQLVSRNLEQRGDLASVVRAIRIAPVCASFSPRDMTPLRADSPTSRILKACRNVKQLELMPPALGESDAALESCTDHMRLDRLGLFDGRSISTKSYVFEYGRQETLGLLIKQPCNIDYYLLLLRQQTTLTQLIIDPQIRDPAHFYFLPEDLPALRSLSACAGIVQLLKTGRSISNVNISLRPKETHDGSRALQFMSEYSAATPSQEPNQRLRVVIPPIGQERMNMVLEHVIAGASGLERLELHCFILSLDMLANVAPRLKSLSELRIIVYGHSLPLHLIQDETTRTWNTFKDVKANSPNLKIFLKRAAVLEVDSLLPSELYPQHEKDGALAMFDGILDNPQPLRVGETMFGHEFWSSDIA